MLKNLFEFIALKGNDGWKNFGRKCSCPPLALVLALSPTTHLVNRIFNKVLYLSSYGQCFSQMTCYFTIYFDFRVFSLQRFRREELLSQSFWVATSYWGYVFVVNQCFSQVFSSHICFRGFFIKHSVYSVPLTTSNLLLVSRTSRNRKFWTLNKNEVFFFLRRKSSL